MFRIGDTVAHYKEGVCQIVKTGKIEISCCDKEKEYYTLKPVYNASGTIYTPVANEKKQIREVISNEEAKRMLATMKEIEEIAVSDEKKREAAYKEAMMTNDCKAWIAVLKTAYGRKMKRQELGKKSINVDEKYLTIAEKFLCGEFAEALGLSREEIKLLFIEALKN